MTFGVLEGLGTAVVGSGAGVEVGVLVGSRGAEVGDLWAVTVGSAITGVPVGWHAKSRAVAKMIPSKAHFFIANSRLESQILQRIAGTLYAALMPQQLAPEIVVVTP